VIIGSGYNGLIAARYLSQAGMPVLVMWRNAEIGGARANGKPSIEAMGAHRNVFQCGLLGLLDMGDQLLLRETGLRHRGVFVIGGAVAEHAGDGGCVTAALEAEHFVVVRRGNPF
jgi:hypothetical protein